MKNKRFYCNLLLALILPIQVVVPPDSAETIIRFGGGRANYVSSVESMVIGYGGCGEPDTYRYELEEDKIKDLGIEIDYRPADSQAHFGVRVHGVGTTHSGTVALGINPYLGLTNESFAFNTGLLLSESRLLGGGNKIRPTIAFRFGPPRFHLSCSYGSDVPLLSNGMLQLGLGIKPFGPHLDAWVGISGLVQKSIGLLAKTNIWVTPDMSLHASVRRGHYQTGNAHSDENSVSLGMSFKIVR